MTYAIAIHDMREITKEQADRKVISGFPVSSTCEGVYVYRISDQSLLVPKKQDKTVPEEPGFPISLLSDTNDHVAVPWYIWRISFSESAADYNNGSLEDVFTHMYKEHISYAVPLYFSEAQVPMPKGRKGGIQLREDGQKPNESYIRYARKRLIKVPCSTKSEVFTRNAVQSGVEATTLLALKIAHPESDYSMAPIEELIAAAQQVNPELTVEIILSDLQKGLLGLLSHKREATLTKDFPATVDAIYNNVIYYLLKIAAYRFNSAVPEVEPINTKRYLELVRSGDIDSDLEYLCNRASLPWIEPFPFPSAIDYMDIPSQRAILMLVPRFNDYLSYLEQLSLSGREIPPMGKIIEACNDFDSNMLGAFTAHLHIALTGETIATDRRKRMMLGYKEGDPLPVYAYHNSDHFPSPGLNQTMDILHEVLHELRRAEKTRLDLTDLKKRAPGFIKYITDASSSRLPLLEKLKGLSNAARLRDRGLQ